MDAHLINVLTVNLSLMTSPRKWHHLGGEMAAQTSVSVIHGFDEFLVMVLVIVFGKFSD